MSIYVIAMMWRE